MTLPASPPLRFSEILTEFGDSAPKSLSDYYGLAGLPLAGNLLSMSDFLGLSAAPDPTYSWYGSFKIQIGTWTSGTGTFYGYRTGEDISGNPRTPAGALLDSYQINSGFSYSSFGYSSTSTTTRWNVVGATGLSFGIFAPTNFTGYDARDVDRVEYTLFSGSSVVGSGTLGGELIDRGDGNKYGTRYVYQVGNLTNTGPLSGVAGMGLILKYCYDNNYDVEFKIIVL
jgi:hypothetical protein